MNFKEKFSNLFSLRRLFVGGNMLLLILFLAALGKDQVRGWKDYQKEFKHREINRAQEKLAAAKTDDEKLTAENELKNAKKMPIEIRQMWVQNIKAVDRCITCHQGYDPLSNSSLVTPYKDQPYSAPADTVSFEIHKIHNFDKFGCVVCHGGQGLATETKAAHGQVAHWESPLLKGTLLQAACFKCHDNINELNIKGTNYTAEIVRAKAIFRENGCIGCHQIAGEGGPVSVDLKEETAAKPLSRIDFAYSGLPHEDWTLANWIKIHFTKDPATFVPGDPEGKFNTEPIPPSAMPPFLLPEADANALTAYILGLNKRGVLPEYRTVRPKEPRPQFASSLQHGRWVFEEYGCSGCHGADARGGIRNFNYLNDVTPNLRRAASTYTRDEIRNKIAHGVPLVAKNDARGPLPPLYMPSWKDKIKGDEMEDLISYLMSIKE